MGTKITRLSIQGFKSFKKRVSIPIYPGFNVFCGPNGSGKSNILDAITFVIGSTSSKTMRAGKLHELIFHGAKNAKSSEYASVTLRLDNSNNIFNFETPEVTITRKVNKKGVSTYKINNKTTTREKMLEILSGAGIYPDGYNIIMQGDVTQIIEMTPNERREIIDEISGISHYNDKRNRAQKDLDKVGEKLREVEIVLTERLERLQELEQDRNLALRYKDLTSRLEILEASLAHQKFVKEEEEYKTSEKDIKSSEEKISELEKNINDLEKEIEQIEKKREELTEKVFMRSKEIGIKDDIQEIKNKILRNHDKIETIQREITGVDNLIERMKSISDSEYPMARAVKEILGLNKQGVHGTIRDLINVPNAYMTAVESAAGFKLQNIVVDGSSTAVDCINFLKRERVGRATFLPLSTIKRRDITLQQREILKKPGVVGLLSDLVKYDIKHYNVMKNIFGDTVVVENLGVARDVGVGKIRMVTLDGDLAEKSGAMIGGFFKGRSNKQSSSQKDIEKYENRKIELQEEINFLNIEIDQFEKKLETLKKSQQDENEEVLVMEKERSDIDKNLEKMKTDRNVFFEERMKLQNKINRLKIKSARTEAEMANWKIEIDKFKSIDYVDEKPEKMENEIEQIKNTLTSFGLVNMKSISEYDYFKESFDKLKENYDKISDEKRSIEDLLEKIEDKRREVFHSCLGEINKNFQSVFRKMTNGVASLELENPVDIESGLMIRATPQGKAMLNIDSMSGGEKTLTALAFLFGIQKYKPSPFYVLDEVDAALDKVNSKKVADIIKKISENDQFIVITHNDYTLKQGNRVYGISLEEGESKILGLELPQTEVN